MKHIFYICQNAENSLGLEKILNFYNVIVLENSDSVEDLINETVNVVVANDFNSIEFKGFIKDLSYGEDPYILSSLPQATLKLSQSSDWQVHGKTTSDTTNENASNNTIRFSIYKDGDKKIFGNIHKVFLKTYKEYIVEVLDWSFDYLNDVKALTESLSDLQNGYTTVECMVEDNSLKVKTKYPEHLPTGIDVFTQAQIMNNEVPFVIHEIFEDMTKESEITFTETFKPSNPVSQSKTYKLSMLNIRTKSETVIKNNLPTGVWKYGGDNTGKIDFECIATYPIDEDGDKTLCLLKRGSNLYALEDGEGIVIATRDKDVNLKTSDTLATIIIPASIVDDKFELYGWVYEIVGAIIGYQMV
jgi:hypothetical protein